MFVVVRAPMICVVQVSKPDVYVSQTAIRGFILVTEMRYHHANLVCG